MRKILLIILDGVGDRPAPALDGKTPLQSAIRPNLNFFAKNGMTGQLYPIGPGVRAGSDTAHLALLGYDPYRVYKGRGPFEALGLNMSLKPGDLAFRANFATVDSTMKVLDRRAGRINTHTEELAKVLTTKLGDVQFIVKAGVEHRAALIMRGPDLSAEISDADPHQSNMKVQRVVAKVPKAAKTAELLNRYIHKSYQLLKDHPVNVTRVNNGKLPANILLPRGPGLVPQLRAFSEKYNLKSACVVGIPLIAGICKLAGIHPIKVKGATGTLASNFSAKIKAAVVALENYEFVLVNIKAPDIAGHDGDAVKKKKVIEQIDTALNYLRNHLKDEYLIAITADHSTPCSVRDHTGDSVPLLIYAQGLRKDSVSEFDEISVMRGGLNIIGKELLPVLLNLSDRAEKFGA